MARGSIWRSSAAASVRLLACLLLLLLLGWRAAAASDNAPLVEATQPVGGGQAAALDAPLQVLFSEPVTLDVGAVELVCTTSGRHDLIAASSDDRQFTLTHTPRFAPGEDCYATVFAERVRDLDEDDPPDYMPADAGWSFSVIEPVATQMMINEVDAVTADGRADFVELFDGGAGGTSLGGLTLVFYSGATAAVYYAYDLDGRSTGPDGYFLLGAAAIADVDVLLADDLLLDGTHAVALTAGDRGDFPFGRPLSVDGIVDALVYRYESPEITELLPLLMPGEVATNENSRQTAAGDSNQRCPNGAGDQRHTSSFRQNTPTPGSANNCRFDAGPVVTSVMPPDGAENVAQDAVLEVTFSEPVEVLPGAFELVCDSGGTVALTIDSSRDPEYRLRPGAALPAGAVCSVTIHGESIRDRDSEDPPDTLSSDFIWRFYVHRPVADFVLINEVDADTPGNDTAEFIELFDGGRGNTDLSGLSIVLFNGQDDRSYATLDLAGQTTNQQGYFVLGNAAVAASGITFANGLLQNGADAIALVAGTVAAFPNGTGAADVDPLDALVYGTGDGGDSGLLILLNPGQPQVDEAGRASASDHSNQRCPNGAGGAQNTAGYKQNTPTPLAANDCVTDLAPSVSAVAPEPAAIGVAHAARLAVTFSEPVSASAGWLTLDCAASGAHALTIAGGPENFEIVSAKRFEPSERCSATVIASRIRDVDNDDPPDRMATEYKWSFDTAGPVADFVLINEIDADTVGADTAEFVELFDGGLGRTDLTGLVLVFFNGNDNAVYEALDLSGLATDSEGYLLIGNSSLSPDLAFANGRLQNGPDAVALYAGSVRDYPDGKPVSSVSLLDAVVYGAADDPDQGLLPLLRAGQKQIDENARGGRDVHSLQRCPNGSGGQRETGAFRPNGPSPRGRNNCTFDDPPAVVSVTPGPGSTDVDTSAVLTIEFSEAVDVETRWLSLQCLAGGPSQLAVSWDDAVATARPDPLLKDGDLCEANIDSSRVHDRDSDDPPDNPEADFTWSFRVADEILPPAFVLINEVDSDTPGRDRAEFIELFDGGAGRTKLDGLILVLFNGATDTSYYVLNLAGQETDAGGYFLIGGEALPGTQLVIADNLLQNGPDAVAIYVAEASDFPNGTPVTDAGLVDALVYGTNDPEDSGLLSLLNKEQPQVDEDSRGRKDDDSSQRCPDGGGGALNTKTYAQNTPTPGMTNDCDFDSAPEVAGTWPSVAQGDVEIAPTLVITFTEDVSVDANWLTLQCATSGAAELQTSGTGSVRSVTLSHALTPGERCEAMIAADSVHDTDTEDPPDNLASDFMWTFTVRSPLCGDPAAAFHAIQGNGDSSAQIGQAVVVEGIVIAATDTNPSGLFLQASTDEYDEDVLTSEALFVMQPDLADYEAEVGDRLRMAGRVAETNGRTTLVEGQLIAACGRRQLPEPQAVVYPSGGPPDWEPVENMRVVIMAALTVAGLNQVDGREGLLVSPDGRPQYPTQTMRPGPAAYERYLDQASRLLQIDLASYAPGEGQIIRAGDEVSGVEGVVVQSNGANRLQLTGSLTHAVRNPRPTAAPPTAGRLRVASVDFTGLPLATFAGSGLHRPDRQPRTDGRGDKVVALLAGLDSDLIPISGLMGDMHTVDAALAALVEELNRALAPDSYALVPRSEQTSLSQVHVAAIYRTDTLAAAPERLALPLPAIEAGAALPQAWHFTERGSGEGFALVVVDLPGREHCPLNGGPDDDQHDGQECGRAARQAYSAQVAAWLPVVREHFADDDVLLTGAMAAYLHEPPLDALREAGMLDAPMSVAPAALYTESRHGHSGSLQHLLASPELHRQLEPAAVWHINADERTPAQAEAGPFGALGVDPILAGLNLTMTPPTVQRSTLHLPVTVAVQSPPANTHRLYLPSVASRQSPVVSQFSAVHRLSPVTGSQQHHFPSSSLKPIGRTGTQRYNVPR